MNNAVYILGAGVNQEIFSPNHLSPPLIDNFFEIALKVHNRFGDYDDRLEDVYKYINKYWRKSKQDLQNEKFDLEECLTLLQLQINDSSEKENDLVYDELYKIQIHLLAFFYEVLDEFKHYIKESNTFLKLGKILYDQKPDIITFNYDDFVETAIELASGKNPPHGYLKTFQKNMTPMELGVVSQKSEWKWNRPLGYGIEFDEILLHDGSPGNYGKHISQNIFYSVNTSYPWKILKLHGSINWYRYVNDSPNPYLNEDEVNQKYESKKNDIVLQSPVWFLPMSDLPWHINQLFLRPIIITPVLYKEFFTDRINRRVFDSQWASAKEVLSGCNKLVIIGYSFPTTDFYSKKLILESTGDNVIDELIVVNPNDERVEYIKKIVPHKTFKKFDYLRDYVSSFFR